MDKREIIERVIGFRAVEGKTYPAALSPTLRGWYCYTQDGGHSILCVLKRDRLPGAELADYLLPLPVKTVLKTGFEIIGDFIIVDMNFYPEIGLQIDENDEEF